MLCVCIFFFSPLHDHLPIPSLVADDLKEAHV
jgi:hypothetical protein